MNPVEKDTHSTTGWLLLVYKVPPEPTARRVYVWRKLKSLGAVLLHDAVWLLPALPQTREKLQWLASEIRDMDGEATLWEAQQMFTGQSADLRQLFINQVDVFYREMLAALEKDDADLAALSKQYQQAKRQDYFNSEMGQRVRDILVNRRGDSSL